MSTTATIEQLQIKIETQADGAIKGLKGLKSALESVEKAGQSDGLDKVCQKLEKISSINFSNLTQLTQLVTAIKNLGDASKKLGKVTSAIPKKPFDDLAQGAKSATAAIDGLPEKVDVPINLPGADTAETATQAVVDDLVNSTSAADLLRMKLDGVKAKLANLASDPDADKGAIANLIQKAQKLQAELDKTRHKFKLFGKDAQKSTKKAQNGFAQLFKIVVIYGTAFRLWMTFTQGVSEGLQNIAQYNTETSAAMSKLSTMSLQLKNSIGAALYPVIVAITPALQYMANAVIDTLNAFNQFIASLSGSKTYIRAKEYLKEYGDTAKKTADKIKKSFAGMDEITVIGDKGGSSSDSGDNPADMFEEVEIDNSFSGTLDKILARVLEIGAAFLTWQLSKKLLGSLSVLTVLLGLVLIIDSIREVITDGLSWESVIKGAIGGALVGAGIGFKFGGPMGALLGATIGVGVTLVVQGITSMISEGVNVENVLSTIIGALTSIGGIVAVVKLFNKKNAASTPAFDTASDTIDDVASNTSGLTSKLKSLVKNLAFGIVIIAEVAVAAGLIVGAIWGLGLMLEQVANAWRPVIDNGDTVCTAVVTGTALLILLGSITAALGSVGASLIGFMALGIATLALVGVSAALFLAEIWAMGLALEQIGIAWQPVINNGDTIANAIGMGTVLLLAIGAACALLGVATVATAGLLPVAIALGTLMMVELTIAFVEFCDSLIEVANKLVELSVPLSKLNAILPGLKSDMDSFTTFMGNFAKAVVTFTATSAIAGIAATIDKVIDLFTTDPVERMYNEVCTQTTEFEKLIPALQKINPLIAKATQLVGVYKSNMGSFESATGGSGGFLNSIVNGAKGVVNGMIGLFENMANGAIKAVNFIVRALNKLSWNVPSWVPGIGGKTFGFNIREISEIRIPRFATGGFPEDGLFMANHGELVGRFSNGKTAVANNEQIVDGIAGGVYAANQEQNRLLVEQNKLLQQLIEKQSNGQIDVTTITAAMHRKNRRDGKTIVPVGI